MTTLPAHKIRIGNLSAIIWPNAGENGTWYLAQPQRIYPQAATSGFIALYFGAVLRRLRRD